MKLMWLGVGFLNRTGAEMGYYLDKKCKKLIIIEKIKKYRKCPALYIMENGFVYWKANKRCIYPSIYKVKVYYSKRYAS